MSNSPGSVKILHVASKTDFSVVVTDYRSVGGSQLTVAVSCCRLLISLTGKLPGTSDDIFSKLGLFNAVDVRIIIDQTFGEFVFSGDLRDCVSFNLHISHFLAVIILNAIDICHT